MTSEFRVAVHALVFLNHRAECLSSEVLSQNICTNPARVRKVMGKLKRAGLLCTKEGAEGGYLFCKTAGEVTLEQIAEALEMRFVTAAWRSGDTDMNCLIASGMAGVMEGIYSDLDRLCKNHLRTITIADIDAMIFKNK